MPPPIRDLDDLGQMIRDARGSRSQAEFAALLGIGQSHLSSLETGNEGGGLDVGLIVLLSDEYGLDAGKLAAAASARKNRRKGKGQEDSREQV